MCDVECKTDSRVRNRHFLATTCCSAEVSTSCCVALWGVYTIQQTWNAGRLLDVCRIV